MSLLAATAAALAFGGADRAQAAAPSPDRSAAAQAVEAKIADANLAEALKAATGSGFAGVWFEPETALVHVGVTSAASREAVDSLARKAGLAANVVTDPVAFTWAQLDAEQRRWDRRLAGLVEPGEVATFLDPKRNAVVVELASRVSGSERSAVEREAAGAGPNVVVATAPAPHLWLETQSRCKEFKANEAFCDPTIVAGQRIIREVKACTAGPAVIHKDRSKAKAATETFFLTAGHCIDLDGGEGRFWSAFDTAAEENQKLIGRAKAMLNGATDVGLIEVEPVHWAKANDLVPVQPTIAPWDKGKEPEPFPVLASEEPMVGTNACMSGQSSGTSCGEIITVGLTIEEKGQPKLENLVEVKGAKAASGDSGAPWFLEVPYLEVNGKFEPTPTGHVLGHHVGRKLEVNPVFHPLATSFAALKAGKEYDLELLTEENKSRHPKVKAKKYPATIRGTGSTEQINTEAGTIKCTTVDYHLGSMPGPAPALTVQPTFVGCTAFGFLEATIAAEGCTFTFLPTEKGESGIYQATVDVLCPAGKSIKVVALTCKVEFKEQKERAAVSMATDSGASSTITVKPNVSGIAYTVTQDGFLCPFNGTGAKTGATYTATSPIVMKGKSTSTSEEIGIEVVDY